MYARSDVYGHGTHGRKTDEEAPANEDRPCHICQGLEQSLRHVVIAEDYYLQSDRPIRCVTKVVVYNRMKTRIVHMTMEKAGKTWLVPHSLGGLSSCGITPTGGTAAGPSSNAVMLVAMAEHSKEITTSLMMMGEGGGTDSAVA